MGSGMRISQTCSIDTRPHHITPNALRLRSAVVILASGLAMIVCGCAHRAVAVGPSPPEATRIVRIDISGNYFRDSAPHAIADPALIAAIATSRWFAAGQWEIHDEPLPANPHYVIEFQGA